MKIRNIFALCSVLFFFFYGYCFAETKISSNTQVCLGCHKLVTAGIVEDWKNSMHSKTSPEDALKKNAKEKRISAKSVSPELKNSVVGCAECHIANNGEHKDNFEHNGFKVHIVVTPSDCAKCHPVENEQYSKNIMSHAYGNLVNNSLYKDFANTVNAIYTTEKKKNKIKPASELTEQDSCLYCHGTKIDVKWLNERETFMGSMKFPVLSGWPNAGVGRLNPDGTKGSCSACHTRHSFSIEMARKTDTCSTCHKGPDVPAYKVYSVSKHGNIYASKKEKWNFDSVPWKIGQDFNAPTCAVCHASEIEVNGKIVVKRTHQMNDRLPHRLFGVPYATAHPKSPDTSIAKNKAGLPLFSELIGEPVVQYLIDEKEQKERLAKMKSVCSSCHSSSFIDGHFARLEESIKTTNEMTIEATKLLANAWQRRLASNKESLFDETIESFWTEQWLFYANSVRFASAMAGADYGVFDNGKYNLSRNIQRMKDWMKFLETKKK